MANIIDLLFDYYTNPAPCQAVEEDPQARDYFRKLTELAGKDLAIEIWDAATGEGTKMQDHCFQSGLRAGLELAMELRSL